MCVLIYFLIQHLLFEKNVSFYNKEVANRKHNFIKGHPSLNIAMIYRFYAI